MVHVYEFEVCETEKSLLAIPFDFDGGAEGEDLHGLADFAAVWLRSEIEHRAIHNIPLPEPSFDNKPRHGGKIIWVAVDAGLHTVPRMSAAEAARALGVTPSRVSHLIRDGLLQASKEGHNTWVMRHSVEERMRNRPAAGRPKRRVDVDREETAASEDRPGPGRRSFS